MTPTVDPAILADQVLATTESERPTWLATFARGLSLDLIAELKRRSDALIKQAPAEAEQMTRTALAVAAHLPDFPLALPLARWARGNWAVFNQPVEALDCYHAALAGYTQVGDAVAVARLASNLVFAYTNLSRFEEALAAANQARDLLTKLGPEVEHYLVNLSVNVGWLLYAQGHYAEALTANQTAMALALRHAMTEAWAELQVNQAFTLGMVGRLAESEALLLNSRGVLGQRQHWLTVARIDLNLGELYSALGRPALALQHFRLARAGFEGLGVGLEYASVLLFEAELLVRLGVLREARRAYHQAYQRFMADAMPQYAAMALLAGATVRRRLNPSDRRTPAMLAEASTLVADLDLPLLRVEITLAQVALALDLDDHVIAATRLAQLQAIPVPPTLMVQRELLRGRIAQQSGMREASRSALTQVLTLSRETGLIWAEREALAGLGLGLVANDVERARTYLEAAVQIDEDLRAELHIEELIASFEAERGDVLAALVRLACAAGQPHEALRHAWRQNGGAFLALLAARQSKAVALDADQAHLALLRQQIATLRWQVARASQEEEPAETLEGLRARLRDTEQSYLVRRRDVGHGHIGTAATLSADPRHALAHLTADRLIEYVRCDTDLLALCADRHGTCTATWLGSVVAVQDLLDRFDLKCLRALTMSAAQRAQQHPWLTEETQTILQQLHAILIAPLPGLPRTGRLRIAACAPLHRVPFAALYDGTNYLVAQYEIEPILSGALLTTPAPRPSRVGPPLVIGGSAEGVLGAVAAEVAAVAAALPTCVCYLDDPAALAYLTSLKQGPQLLHLSAHTELDPEPSIFSGLQLAGAMLTIEHCYDLPLVGTELVVLNGCGTATGMESGGALLAFQSAFLVAGAQRVLGSLWQVHDEFAATMMAAFYRFLVAGYEAPAALRAAQSALLNDPATAHPALWAAFALMGR